MRGHRFTVRTVDLHLDPGNPLPVAGAKKDAAIGALLNVEFKIKNIVDVYSLRSDDAAAFHLKYAVLKHPSVFLEICD